MTHEALESDFIAGSTLPLLVWLSPSFPVGAFAYSHGIEAAVEAGDISDAANLRGWLSDILQFGAGRNDAILLACAWRAARQGDFDALTEINDLALALSPSGERCLETRAQGDAFIAAISAAWPCATMDGLAARATDGVAYPVALAAAAAGHDVPLHATLEAALLAFLSNLVSAAVRLGSIGQTDGQKIIAGLMPLAQHIALYAETAESDDIGGASFRSDIASMRHETQYSRLFRS